MHTTLPRRRRRTTVIWLGVASLVFTLQVAVLAAWFAGVI